MLNIRTYKNLIRYSDAIAAATRQQSNAEITHVFKNQNQGTV